MNAFPTSSSLSAVATPSVMKRNSSILLGALCTALLLLSASHASAQANAKPPTQLTYQGFLTDGNGVPFGNTAPVNKTVRFRIYDALTGGTLKWSSEQVVTVDKGYFSVLLGQGSQVGTEPFSADLSGIFAGSATASDRYLELQADGTIIAPRLRFLPAPYAVLAKSATELVDPTTGTSSLSIDGGVIRGNGAGLTAVNGTNISSGTIADSKLAVITTPGKVANSATTATSTNAANAIVARDGSGNFSAGTVTATSFSGSGANVTSLNASQITTGTLGNDRTSATTGNTANAIVARDGSGGFTAGRIRIEDAAVPLSFNETGQSVQEGGAWRMPLDGGVLRFDVSTSAAGDFSTSKTPLAMTRNGYVGIGTTSPSWPLHAVNDSNAAIGVSRPNGQYAVLYRLDNALFLEANDTSQARGATRWMRFDGDGNWDFSSDRRLKTDIVGAEPMLDLVMQVQVRRYRWKTDAPDAQPKLGVVAQELQPLFPHMVSEVDDPKTREKTLCVGYGDFAVIAIQALQEFKRLHDSETSNLKAKIAKLAQENEKLQAAKENHDQRLAAIEKFIAAQSRTGTIKTSSVRGGN